MLNKVVEYIVLIITYFVTMINYHIITVTSINFLTIMQLLQNMMNVVIVRISSGLEKIVAQSIEAILKINNSLT